MFCDQCGFNNVDGAQFCNHCGRQFQAAPMPGFASAAPASPSMNPVEQKADGKAIASLVLGMLSLFCWIFTGIPAVILGHVSRSDIKRSMGRLKGEGMALTGLIMGYLSIAAVPFILIIAAIAIPNLLRARMAANEATAVNSVRTIATAASAYKATHPDEGYPASMDAMPELDRDLLGGSKAGYHFVYEVRNMSPEGNGGFFVRAIPNVANNTGSREFCAEESGLIHSTTAQEPCTAESAVLE